MILNGRKMVLLWIGVCVMTGCATTYKPNVPKGGVEVVAHRGASAYAPENTLASFDLAADLHADWFELDCMLSKDGEVVIYHDDKVARITGAPGHVWDYTLAELKQLDAGAWKDAKFKGERIPTFAEALDLAKAKGVGIYVEIKMIADDSRLMNDILTMTEGQESLTPAMRRKMMAMIKASGSKNLELTRKVVALIQKHRMGGQVVVQSFSPIICAIVLDEAPRLRMEMLALKDKDQPQRWPMYLRWAELLHVRGFNTNLECFDEALLAKFHARGMTMAMWTIDDEADMRRLAQAGIDRIITNKPDVCLKVLGDMGKH